MKDLTKVVKNNYENLDNVISHLYVREDLERKVQALKGCKKSEYPSFCAEISKLYKSIGVECEVGQNPKYYENLLNSVPEGVLCETKEELDFRILECLYKAYKAFPAPSEIMKRILDNCGSEEFKDEKILRLRILKEFLKYADAMKVAGKEGEGTVKKYIKKKGLKNVLEVDDGIFELLKSANKYQRRDTYALLVLAQELAEGRFKNSGASKEPLYLLAIILGMHYYDIQDEKYCAEKDFVKNIFNDYYNDNLIRYITSYKNVNPSAYENEPLGLGVDYKNYAEAIFIYYMNKDNYTPLEKITKIYNLFNKIEAKNKDEKNSNGKLLSTKSVKENFISRFLKLEEDELVNYLLSNYNIKFEEGKSRFMISFDRNSVAECYNSIVEDMCCSLNVSTKAYIEYINTPTKDEKKIKNPKQEFKSILKTNEVDVDKLPYFDEDFKTLIKMTNKRLDLDKSFSLYKADEKTRISRTKLISAYYHYYCVDNFDNPLDLKFTDVLKDFEEWLNDSLEQAGFCKLDYKNVFDMLVVFFAYCRINNNLYDD